ncbi:hypothetical protein B4109_3112 [Geobacillus stearothermophilus]|uniref:Uncharacterized protein n=1 Tax=Geobacillus stearothermophilus TaxID=1422 RepID=A0A150MSW3_GEOSE|nr:hypothetical protein B4109_3112 [Geobacillus stearothermophilus]
MPIFKKFLLLYKAVFVYCMKVSYKEKNLSKTEKKFSSTKYLPHI